MLAVELRFLRGRFHATPWGRNVNEGIPEWPPSPFRLARALYDAWRRKRSDWPRERVEPLLAALAGDDVVFALPRARASHLRLFYRQGDEDLTNKKKVFDAFVVLDPGARAVAGFPAAELTNGQRADLDELCSLVGYLGRAESLASLRVVDTEGPWNCVPAAASDDSKSQEIVRVAGLARLGEHVSIETGLSSRAKRRGEHEAATTLGWLDAVGWGSEMTIERKLSQPPALKWVDYRRDAAALSAAPAARAPAREAALADTVVLALDGKVRPRVTESIRVAEELRRRAMGAYRSVMGGDPDRKSARFTGKDPSGRPLSEDHAHASFLPWDRDGDGVIDHVIVSARAGFDRDELRALQLLRPLAFPSPEHPSMLLAVAIGRRDALLASESSRVFRSATPFIPTRHFRAKRDGAHHAWLRAEVARSLLQHGLPELVAIEQLEHHELADGRRVRWLEFRRARKVDTPELGFGFRIELAGPVVGPFSIGRGAHFGLGLFMPARRESRRSAPDLA